jgi:hypothetical protein
MTGLARERLVARIPQVGLRPHLRTAEPAVVAPVVTDEAAPLPVPSMRGLELSIAIASLASAILLGLLR